MSLAYLNEDKDDLRRLPRVPQARPGARCGCAWPPPRSTATRRCSPLYTALGTRIHNEEPRASTGDLIEAALDEAGLPDVAGRRDGRLVVRRGASRSPTTPGMDQVGDEVGTPVHRDRRLARSSARWSARSRAARTPAGSGTARSRWRRSRTSSSSSAAAPATSTSADPRWPSVRCDAGLWSTGCVAADGFSGPSIGQKRMVLPQSLPLGTKPLISGRWKPVAPAS